MKKICKIGGALILSVLLSTIFNACDKDDNNSTPKEIQTGLWSSPSEDVQFYITQQSVLDTLRITLSFSGNCSGTMIYTTYPVSITNRSFFRDLGSTWNESTGSIEGTFSSDGKNCSGTYDYTDPPCSTISESWTATPH